MKTLILGDIHGRDCWVDIIVRELPDMVVFLGDYVSTHEGVSSKKQIAVLDAILQYREKNPDRVILLRGNHDMQHLGYSWAECSGYDCDVAEYMEANKERFLSLTQWVWVNDGVIYSHAGVSEVWMHENGITSVDEINLLEPTAIFGFTPCVASDFCGTSVTQPCTWIRPFTLKNVMPANYTQVVGHTPTKSIEDFGELYPKTNNHLWCCDNLPRQYLLNIDGEFVVRNYEE